MFTELPGRQESEAWGNAETRAAPGLQGTVSTIKGRS